MFSTSGIVTLVHPVIQQTQKVSLAVNKYIHLLPYTLGGCMFQWMRSQNCNLC